MSKHSTISDYTFVYDIVLCVYFGALLETALEVNHNKIAELDGSASYDPDLPDGAQTVGIDFTWSCRQDEQVKSKTQLHSTYSMQLKDMLQW